MEKFAGYGFNKSHAAAYSLLAYHTAWIKVHCTAEFYAANMTIEVDNTDKLQGAAGRRQAVRRRASSRPTSTAARYRFEPVDDQAPCATAWARSRAPGRARSRPSSRRAKARRRRQGGGPFRSLFDFCARVDRQRVNKRAVEALIKAGAFDALHPEQAGRAALLASVGLAFDWAETQAANALQGGPVRLRRRRHGSSTQEPALVHVPRPGTCASG